MRRHIWVRILVGMSIGAGACVVFGCWPLPPTWPAGLADRIFGLGMLLAGPPLVVFLFKMAAMTGSRRSKEWQDDYFALRLGVFVLLGALILMGSGLAVLCGITTPTTALEDLCRAFEHK